MLVDLKWSNFNSERMESPIWQRWFCSVGSPCIVEAIHWSQPLHTVEKLLFWKLGFSSFFLCKVILILENFLCHQAAAVLVLPNCQSTIYHRFVDIFLCKVILKTSSVTKQLQCLWCQIANQQYITGLLIYYLDMTVLMACSWKNSVLLAAYWVKRSIFHLG